MKILFILSALSISSFGFSQTQEIVFGYVGLQEMEMTNYEKDPEAKAVVLYDRGESVFFDSDGGYDIRFKRHRRIKIFKKTEADYTTVSIPFYADGYGKTEKVRSIEAVTYNLSNGRIISTKVSPSTIYEERINENWFNRKFVFPDVQDGSVLEYQYELETPFHFHLPDWTFQDEIPTIYSEYTVSMIPFYEYIYMVQGIQKFDYQNSELMPGMRTFGRMNTSVYGVNYGGGIEFQDYQHTYVLKDIPAFIDESYITSANDYIIKMDFQLAKLHNPRGTSSDVISTWTALNEALLRHENFGKYLKSGSRAAKNILKDQLQLDGLDEKAKAKKIINYVKDSYEWNGNNSKYSSLSTKDFLNKKTGNSADINLFLIALLQEAGIDAQPLILSTRNHGKINASYPFDHFTNYVIALVETDYIFLADATEEYLPFNSLPLRCYNEKGLIVNENEKPSWISLSNNFLSIEKNTISMTIDTTTLNANVLVAIQNTAYKALSKRKQFNDDTLRMKAYYDDKIGEIDRVITRGYDRVNLPYSLNFKGNYETDKLGNNIVIKPFMTLPMAKNTLTQEARTYPIDFVYPWEDQFCAIIEIPESYTLVNPPKTFELENELADIHLNYTLSENVLTVTGNYKFNKATYVAEEYPKIKTYMDQIIRDFNQSIVLEKK